MIDCFRDRVDVPNRLYTPLSERSRHNLSFHGQYPTERCVRATERAEFSGQCTPSIWGAVRRPKAWSITKAGGLGLSDMENISELPA